MKKWICAVLTAVLILSLAACGNSGYLEIVKDGKTQYTVVSYLEETDAVQKFSTKMLVSAGAVVPVADEAKGAAIYVGTPDVFSEATDKLGQPGYGGYEIVVDGENIFVSVSDTAAADEALTQLRGEMEKYSDSAAGVKKDLHIFGNICKIKESIPAFTPTSGTPSALRDAGNGNYEILYDKVDAASIGSELDGYRKTLEKEGFTCYCDNRIGDNQFSTYYKEDAQVYFNYFPALKQVRVVFGAKEYLPDTTPIDCEKVVTPSFVNIGMTDNVQCMVFQAADGTFVVIDGGWGESKVYDKVLNQGKSNERTIHIQRDVDYDMESLMTYLKENTPGGGKPQVIWMITHADPDHITLPPVFFEKYADQFDLKMYCDNFPNILNIGLTNGGSPSSFAAYAETYLNAAQKYFPDAEHYIYHTGQKLQLPGGAEIEFLFSHEDYWPNEMPWMNSTCGGWRFTVEGKTILILGDMSPGLNNQMAKTFGSYVKSDVFQPAHHGANGGTLLLYKLVDPTVCFWSCQQYQLDYDDRHRGIDPNYDFNKFLRESPNVIADYSNSETAGIVFPSLEKK